jgi:hypothetical protein
MRSDAVPRERFATPTASGINAVVDSAQQVLDLACACLSARIIERDCAAETDLWVFQPCSRFFDIAENCCRVSEQSRKTNHFVRFIRRQSPRGFAPLQSRSRNAKFRRELLKWQVEGLLQSLQLSETQALLNSLNQVCRMACFLRMHSLFQRGGLHSALIQLTQCDVSIDPVKSLLLAARSRSELRAAMAS